MCAQADTLVEGRRQIGTRSPVRRRSVADEPERIAELCGRIDLKAHGPDLARGLLEPIASLLGAETASLRCLGGSAEPRIPRHIASLGISDIVHDAYMTRYYKVDPARRLWQCPYDEPIFVDPRRPGEWTHEMAPPALMRRHREEFAAYLRRFLIPNDFANHVGFSFRSGSGQIVLLDFHRGRRRPRFDGCEVTRARAVARYLHSRAAKGWTCVDDEQPCAPGADTRLSARELEVAEAVAGGLSNKEVATSLDISVRTVENHMRSIFAKLGVSSRTRLAVELRDARA